MLIFVTIQILEVLLIGESKFLTNQKCYPDLGSDASSLWNFCARFSDVTSRGKQWWRRKMWVVCFSGYAGSFTSGNATLHLMGVSWHKGSAYAWQKLMYNDAKVRWLLASQQCTQNLLASWEWGKKSPPLKLHYRLSFLAGCRKLEWTLAYRSCGTRERERERERAREKSLYFFLRSLACEFKNKMDIWASPKSELLSKTERALWTIINGLENTLSSLSDGHQSKIK